MSEQPIPAKLFYLSQPAPGVFLVNIQTSEGFKVIDVSADQVRGFIADGAAMAFRSQVQA